MENKKAQIEMVGLLIVVILILVGVLFYIRLSLMGGEDNSEQSIKESIVASNLVLAMLKVEVCSDVKTADVIYSCDQGLDICGGNACSLLEGEVGTIIDAIGWEGWYLFVANRQGEADPVLEVGLECTSGIASEEYSFSSGGLNYGVKLWLCML